MIIVLAPDLGQRRYTEIADRVSMPARHLFWVLVAVSEDGRIGQDTLRAAITQSGHDWIPAQVQAFLKELASAHCLTFRRVMEEFPTLRISERP
jgi:hypothetical protein